ncbi:hypothetical protein GOV07_01785 [Candidatus Woesearchaeota archaeon]|nr:hypothetical protein [Candidatus Woesearchaeota archaeon]
MKTKLYSSDIECDSCVKVLGRVLDKHKGITSFSFKGDCVEVEHDKTVKATKLVALFKSKGYRASLNPELRPSIRERTKEFLSDKKKYAIERKMVGYVFASLILFIILELAALYYAGMRNPGFFEIRMWWGVYLAISVAFLAGAIWHFKSYRGTVGCMLGMMIGMTIGMQTGMLVGAVLGATNGFFMGAFVGMLLASAVGAWTGNCCGVMGIMEGLMAGLMGGTMGAMITVMMFTNHVHIFMPFFLVLNIIILIGFSYMLFEEMVEGKDVQRVPMSFLPFLGVSLLVLAALTAIIIWAPPSIFMG